MLVVILSGGRGKRLRPITDYVPKPLITLHNIPIIEWQIKYCKKFGIKEFVICTGYKTEQIENYLKAKNNLNVKIHFSIEKSPLGTGGAIKKAGVFIKDKSFFVINGDVITNLNMNKLKSKPNSIASIALRTNYGVLDVSNDKIKKFNEKKNIEHLLMNAGVYYLSKNILKDLPRKGNIETTTFSKYAKLGKLNHVKFNNVIFYSIDSPKDIENCSKEITKIIN